MKRSERITVLMTPEMVKRLDAAMWTRALHSRSELVRQYVDEGLIADRKKALGSTTE